MDDEPVIILTTAGAEEAPVIARALVTKRLAACVNSAGVSSIYRWKGEICEEREALLVIKTVRRLAEDVMGEIRDLHSYELPEMILLPVSGGYPPYLQWLIRETGP